MEIWTEEKLEVRGERVEEAIAPLAMVNLICCLPLHPVFFHQCCWVNVTKNSSAYIHCLQINRNKLYTAERKVFYDHCIALWLFWWEIFYMSTQILITVLYKNITFSLFQPSEPVWYKFCLSLDVEVYPIHYYFTVFAKITSFLHHLEFLSIFVLFLVSFSYAKTQDVCLSF